MSGSVGLEQHYTLGIAGHIDHGKTTLTKALTGKNTDRLKEEQLRKISIELGFASFPLSNGKNVGVVDVPGHERFIRQMVAGVAGIDLVLLVIAADEGVMPQTKEHLDILHLLGIKRGIIVITKIDTVDEEFKELVKESVREEVQETFLADSPILEVNSITGQGIPELKQEVERITSTIPARSIQGIARLPIDRVFSKKGFGTIVTGTMYQGKISVGDELEILPARHIVKVRNLQVHDSPQHFAYAGQRVAINLSDVSVDDIKRGDVLVTRKALESTTRIDIEFHMLKDLDFNLKQRGDIRLHVGTSEVLGRMIFFDRNELLPGETCFAQLELSEPIVTVFEERFVVRRPTPMTTIGGGMVIDPYAKRHRFGTQTVEAIAAKKEGDLATRASQVLLKEGMLTRSSLIHQLGVSLQDWTSAIENEEEKGLKLIKGDTEQLTLITTLDGWEQTWSAIDQELEQYHKRYPLREGLDRLTIQKKYFTTISAAQWNVVLKEAVAEHRIQVKQEYISRYAFTPALRPKDEEYWELIQAKMQQSGIEIPDWPDLIPSGMTEESSIELQRWLLRSGKIVQIADERYISTTALDTIVDKLKQHFPVAFSVQEVRQVYDASRKYLIPFLETLDRLQITTREENERKWKK